MIPRVVIFDLDGTLAKSKSPMTKEMGESLAKLLTVIPVAIMSGGSWKQFESQLLPAFPERTQFDRLYLFPVSAGQCLQYTGSAWKTLYTESFTEDEKKKILSALDDALVETGMKTSSEKTWGERIEDRGAQITFSGLGQDAPVEDKKRWDPDIKKRAPLVAALKHRLPEFSIRANASSSVDITREGVSKASGLERLAKLTDIPVHEMLYVGDALFPGGNDAVVYEKCIDMCVMVRPVENPEDTERVIQELLEGTKETELLTRTLTETLEGDVDDSLKERARYSHDTSVFQMEPSLVVYPKNVNDVTKLVQAVKGAKEKGAHVSVTARSAGTDMSGGPLTHSVVSVFTKYMNNITDVAASNSSVPGSDGYAVCEPGVYYRDFEKATLAKNLLLPSYPASRSIAAMGGIVANNSGGERTLKYGKTERYVEELQVVLSDGSLVTFKALGPDELIEKKKLNTLEGEIYRRMSTLLIQNRDLIEAARPKVSKNSAGYALWDVFNIENGIFDLTKLITGSQGTLALVTQMKLALVHPKPYRAMLIIFLKDLAVLPEIVRRVLTHNPESFESYDDHTLSLAVRFLPQMLSQMGIFRATRLGMSFLPEVVMAAGGGIPKLILMAEFSEDTHEQALEEARKAQEVLTDLNLPTRIAKDEAAAEKYWMVRRESFSLLRKNLHGLYASPFIDDFVVPPDSYPEFLPKLNALLAQYDLIYTIAGHVGNGNFHIIPLMDLGKEEHRKTILELAPKVYDLVISYGGTTTGEHNDGIIRTPYLRQLFGDEMVALFEETKRIFDPLNILNPGKKVGGTFDDIKRNLLHHAVEK